MNPGVGARDLLLASPRDGPLHLTLLDPASQSVTAGVEIAERAAELGTDAFLVGGSTGVTLENLDALVGGMKARTHLPVVHFPSSAGAVSPRVDAILFMTTLNSGSLRYLVDEQVAGAPLVHDLGLQTVGMAYIIVEPGMTVGRVSEARLVPRAPEGAELAAAYVLAAQYLGIPLAYLEAGSGADRPVPASHVRAVKEVASIPLVVGGGIRTGDDATGVLEAGADVVVTGTVAEDGDFHRLRDIIGAVADARKRRRS